MTDDSLCNAWSSRALGDLAAVVRTMPRRDYLLIVGAADTASAWRRARGGGVAIVLVWQFPSRQTRVPRPDRMVVDVAVLPLRVLKRLAKAVGRRQQPT